jgi:hypothetical protein
MRGAKSLATLVVVLGGTVWAVAPASADSSITLASGAGLVAPFGTVQDPAVQVSTDGQNWSPAYTTDSGWPTPLSGSSWDVPSPDPGQGYGDPQDFFYRISFTIPAGFPSATLSGAMGADDQPVAVWLNGTQIANYPYEGYVYDPSPHPFSTSDPSLLHTGTNVLELETLNLGGATAIDFSATVASTDDLTLAAIPDQTVNASSPSGAVVTFSPQASDPDDGVAPTFSCNPASGSVFAVGTTTVTCTATDGSGDGENAQTASFNVTVLGAAAQTSNLATTAQALSPSLGGQVQTALASLASGAPAQTAVNQLNAFIHHVSAQSGKSGLSKSQANALIASAQQIIATIG